MRAPRGARVCLALSLLGVGLCVYLGWVHIGLLRGELFGGIACGAPGSIFDCHAVTAGRWGSALGLPLWVWGLTGYVATATLALLACWFPESTPQVLVLLSVLAVGFVAVDAALLSVMMTQIRYLCPLCLGTYLVNLLLAFLGRRAAGISWPQLFRQLGGAMRAIVPWGQRSVGGIFWSMVLVGAAGAVAVDRATTFVAQGSPQTLRKQLRDFVAKEVRVHPDTSGDPAVGPANASITMIEFSDFLCPACQRAAKLTHIILANHRRDVRFVFKNYPLDTSCNTAISRPVHPGACAIAAAAECAHQQDRFWPLHDRVFERAPNYNPSVLEQEAGMLGIDLERFKACMAAGEGMAAVRRDVDEGRAIGVSSTPTYVVNGVKLPGMMSPVGFEELVATLRESDR